MEAVCGLLEQGTFHEASVEEIAGLAGVATATLYQHFGSRVGLVEAICGSLSDNPSMIAIQAAPKHPLSIHRVYAQRVAVRRMHGPTFVAREVSWPKPAQTCSRNLRVSGSGSSARRPAPCIHEDALLPADRRGDLRAG